ncbi:MAG: lysostaphin resistance A-like protein [Acidimicrobiales bacterium]
MAAVILSNVLASIWLSAHPEDDELSLGGQGLATIGLWVGLVGTTAYATYRKGARSFKTDFGFVIRPVDGLIGLVTGILAQVVLLPVIALLLRPVLGEPDVSRTTEKVVNSAEGIGLVVLLVFVVVGAALVEELFFRGLLLRSLLRRLGTPPAVVLSGILFGLAHPQALPAKALALVMVSLAALGAVLAVLAVRTGRLGASIVAHATFNLWTLIALLSR